MVSLRCKMVVKSALESFGLSYSHIELGEVEIRETLTPEMRSKLEVVLLRSGLELMDDKKAMLIEKIKTVVIEIIHYSDELPHVNFSHYLSNKLGYNYNYLANLFSEITGTTIEHYIISHKIERVKELLLYNELNLTEISYLMNYSSVGHLSNQFKKVTGLTPTFFKQLKQYKNRISLEDL
ncbi:MAG: AraC family transcriptional regulator [Saprospirales bacterium]|nr:MAG: AraC family transcriptional regulator [Saprospirales bacterium]